SVNPYMRQWQSGSPDGCFWAAHYIAVTRLLSLHFSQSTVRHFRKYYKFSKGLPASAPGLSLGFPIPGALAGSPFTFTVRSLAPPSGPRTSAVEPNQASTRFGHW